MRALRAADASSFAVTSGGATTTGNRTFPPRRSSDPSPRTTVCAASSSASLRPTRSGSTSIRSPSRTTAAFFGGRSTEPAMRPRAKSSAALETARRGNTSAPKNRVCRRRNPRIGPNPSPALAAAATAPVQSGLTPSWFAANAYDSSPATNVTGSSATSENSRSSFATAWLCVSPPTSTPPTRAPAASSRDEPANASPSNTPMTAKSPATNASVTSRERLRPRRRARGAIKGESARTERRILAGYELFQSIELRRRKARLHPRRTGPRP